MTYTILLNGGKEIEVEHPAKPDQMQHVLKSHQEQKEWVQFITEEGNYYVDTLAIQGYRPHGDGAATFGQVSERAKKPKTAK